MVIKYAISIDLLRDKKIRASVFQYNSLTYSPSIEYVREGPLDLIKDDVLSQFHLSGVLKGKEISTPINGEDIWEVAYDYTWRSSQPI